MSSEDELNGLNRSHEAKEFARAAQILTDSSTEAHRFCGPDSSRAWFCSGSRSSERVLGMGKRVSEHS
jgi:hypothetical protein